MLCVFCSTARLKKKKVKLSLWFSESISENVLISSTLDTAPFVICLHISTYQKTSEETE